MRKNNCEVVRRELDELMPGEVCSTVATEHLRDCASCREFHAQQTKLRQIIGNLGTVEAPADFDFRLRARLAQSNGSSLNWMFVRRGLAAAAMMIVFVTGVLVVRNVMKQSPRVETVAQQPEVHEPRTPDEIRPVVKEDNKPEQVVAGISEEASPVPQKGERRRVESKKRTLPTLDSAFGTAEVINGALPLGASAFPINASDQTFRVSLDDGRGNAKTISFPTLSFGSQRIVQNANQVAPKRVW